MRGFNQRHLEGAYPYALLIDSRDLRQIDVAILSKLELANVRSHVDDPAPDPTPTDPWMFSRDCLELDLLLNRSGAKRITLFINHLKSKLGETEAKHHRARAKRERQAKANRKIVKARFPGNSYARAWFAIVGDLDDEPLSPPLSALVDDAGLENVLDRLSADLRWTHWYRAGNSVGQLDYVLLSPALSLATARDPYVERRDFGFARVLGDGSVRPKVAHLHRRDEAPQPAEFDHQFPRFDGISPKQAASDHCPVFLEIP